jgi:hypothetical protein
MTEFSVSLLLWAGVTRGFLTVWGGGVTVYVFPPENKMKMIDNL